MSSSLRDVVSGALFQELRMNTLANNIANISTTGYKEDRVSFKLPTDLEAEGSGNADDTRAMSSHEIYLGHPVQTYINFSPGQVLHTGNPLDFAIEGSGFFKVSTPEGEQYTRNGNFTRNTDGVLVTEEGYPVLGQGGEIQLDGEAVEVDGAGNILVDGVSVDTLVIADFPDMAGLEKAGNNNFTPVRPDTPVLDAENAQVIQGATESANVQSVQSMTEMIEVVRGYETYQKVIQFLNEANEKAINELGQPG